MNGNGKRRYRRSRRQGKYTKKAATLAPKTANAVKKIVKYEMKKEDEAKQFQSGVTSQVYYGTTAGATATLKALIVPDQGVADNQRVGDSIKLKMLTIRITFFNNYGMTANPANLGRLIIFQYKQSNTVSAPLLSNMFITGSGSGEVNVYSSQNRDNAHIYTILYDRPFFTAGSGGSSATESYQRHMVIKVPLKFAKKQINFLAGGVNATDQIYLCVLGEQGTVGSNPFCTYDWMIRYTDC